MQLELCVNMFGHWWQLFWNDGWNIFDFVVVSPLSPKTKPICPTSPKPETRNLSSQDYTFHLAQAVQENVKTKALPQVSFSLIAMITPDVPATSVVRLIRVFKV
jgi:hypothetical protein